MTNRPEGTIVIIVLLAVLLAVIVGLVLGGTAGLITFLAVLLLGVAGRL